MERALERLLSGKAKVAKKGARLGVAAVCEEAGGIERSTVYRYHEPILIAIERAKKKIGAAGAAERIAREVKATKKRDDFRALAEQAQSETAALARINYRLQARVVELEELVRQRDATIRSLQGPVKRVK